MQTTALADIDRLKARPRAGLGVWPTPLERCAGPDDVPLWIKRDDRSGLGRGGAKARKIDLLLGHMRAHGYDELITIAGNVTNLAFDLLPALERFGLRATLFIADDPPLPAAEREQIFAGVRAGLCLISASRLDAAKHAAVAWRAARNAGRKPLLILPGAAHPLGVLGNALGFLEMAEQLEQLGEPLPQTVLVTAATGTTIAGFLLAAALLRAAGRAQVRVLGVQAYGGMTRVQTLALLRWSERALGLSIRVPRAQVELDASALAGGFGCYTAQQAALCERVAGDYGLAIDPIFGGKTWSVMERRARELRGADGSLLYWHCGFTPEWALLGAAMQARHA